MSCISSNNAGVGNGGGNGATATIKVENWDTTGVVLTRYYSTGTSAGLSARYQGQLNGNKIENCVVTWTWNGNTWSGT
jgi:hypothetical protein